MPAVLTGSAWHQERLASRPPIAYVGARRAVAIKFDTLKFARQLTDAGMDQRQAEAIVLGLADADTSEFATKQDIARLELVIAELKAELFRFMYLQAVTVIGLTVGLTTGLTVALIKLLPG